MPRFSTVRQFCQENKAFKEGGIRNQIFNEHNNGLAESGAIIRNGRKVLLVDEKYFAWLLSRNQGGAK